MNQFKIILVSVLLSLSAGCAGIMTKPFPDQTSQIKMMVLGQEKSEQPNFFPFHDWPNGVYQIPDSNVFIANVQGDEDMIAPDILFGVIGIAVAGGDIAGASKNKLGDLDNRVNFDAPKITQTCFQEALGGLSGTRYFLTTDSDEASLQIFPYMVFSFAGTEKARLWVILKASLIDGNFNQVEWKCRYIAGLGEPRPFQGKDSWVMLLDLEGKLKNGQSPEEEASGCWAFYKNPRQVKIKMLSSDDQEDIVQPLVDDDEYFAGVNILPKDFFLGAPVLKIQNNAPPKVVQPKEDN